MTKDEFIKSIIPEIDKDVYGHSNRLNIEIEGISYDIKKTDKIQHPTTLKYWDDVGLIVHISDIVEGSKVIFDDDGQYPLPSMILNMDGYRRYEKYRETLTPNKPVHVVHITTYGDEWSDEETLTFSTLDEVVPYISGEHLEKSLAVSGIKDMSIDVSLFISRKKAGELFTLEKLTSLYDVVDNFSKLFYSRKL